MRILTLGALTFMQLLVYFLFKILLISKSSLLF